MKFLLLIFLVLTNVLCKTFTEEVEVNYVKGGKTKINIQVTTKEFDCKSALWKLPSDLPRIGYSLFTDVLLESDLFKKASSAVKDSKFKVQNNDSQDDIKEKTTKKVNEQVEDIYKKISEAVLGYYNIVKDLITTYWPKVQGFVNSVRTDGYNNYKKFEKKQKFNRQSPLASLLYENAKKGREWLHENFPASITIEKTVYEYLAFIYTRFLIMTDNLSIPKPVCNALQNSYNFSSKVIIVRETKKEPKLPRFSKTNFLTCRSLTSYGSNVDPTDQALHFKAAELLSKNNLQQITLSYKPKDKADKLLFKIVC